MGYRRFFAVVITAGLASMPPVYADPMEERLRACAACHGAQGRTADERYYPAIAGKPATYLYNQLLNFRDGRRENVVMERMLATLANDYLRAMAEHYAKQPPPAREPLAGATPAQLALGRRLVHEGDAARGIPACRDCHGARLQGDGAAIPGLPGLTFEYLTAQFGAWRAGTRKAMAPDCMAQVAQRLTAEEISAAAAWIASQPHVQGSSPGRTAPLPIDCGGTP